MPRRRRRDAATGPSGVLLVDKPEGPTSRTVVSDLARRLDLPSAGHCGTLDPRASGLLVVVSGAATRVQDLFTGHDKRYEAVVRLGATSATDDGEGPIVSTEPPPTLPEPWSVGSALRSFVGEIEQRPPAVSAVHVDGQRAWKRVRDGEEVEVPSRKVVVHAIEGIQFEWPTVSFDVSCGAGTYIRSIARDVGELLGCGGYLESLRRTRAGRFDVADAVAPEDATAERVLPLEAVLDDVPRVDVPEADLDRLMSGQELSGAEMEEGAEPILWCAGKVIARGLVLADGRYRMRRIIR